MPSRPSFAARAVLAIVLMIGFYLLALAIAGGLLFLAYADIAYTKRPSGKLIIGCVIGAGIILWSILPRIDRFEVPWPRLDPREHPRLFALIREVAGAAGQSMPVEVYLDPTLNAWVAQRGGVMGIGSRRVMGIGLPLLAVVKTSELRAVLAHEFGHYYAGDTKLGPWVYKTRGAIIRTVQTLAKGGQSILYLPFLGYGKLFLRITNAVSRAQEFAADALAARVAGRAAAASALHVIHGSALAFDPYINVELEPILGAGYRPPIAEGFARFLRASQVSSAVERAVEEEMRESQKDPYDTHPPLKDRLAAIESISQSSPPPANDPPAIALLDRLPETELRLLKTVTNIKDVGGLKQVGWDAVGDRIYIPMWEEHLRKHAAALKGLTPAGLPEAAAGAEAFGRRVGVEAGASKEEAVGRAVSTLGAALAVALHRQGWALDAGPGAPVTLRKGEAVIEPFRVVGRLAMPRDAKTPSDQDPLDPAAWRATCEAHGIGGLDLGAAGGGAA
jgi:heat shock protein HtpX